MAICLLELINAKLKKSSTSKKRYLGFPTYSRSEELFEPECIIIYLIQVSNSGVRASIIPT